MNDRRSADDGAGVVLDLRLVSRPDQPTGFGVIDPVAAPSGPTDLKAYVTQNKSLIRRIIARFQILRMNTRSWPRKVA